MGTSTVAEKWLAIASIVLVAACGGPRELTYKDVQAMTEDEKKVACREALGLRTKSRGSCSWMGNAEDRQRCVRKIQSDQSLGLMNYVILDCTRVKFHEPAAPPGGDAVSPLE